METKVKFNKQWYHYVLDVVTFGISAILNLRELYIIVKPIILKELDFDKNGKISKSEIEKFLGKKEKK